MTLTTHTAVPKPRHVPERPAGPARLALRWLVTFRWHLLLLFTSDLGRSMITRKYDAFTTDASYSTTASGIGPLGRIVDRIVRARDTHVALRQRLEIVTSEIVEATLASHSRGSDQVRLASGPVGLGRDLRQAWSRLEALNTTPASWLEVVGVDLDPSGTVLDEASRLAAEEIVPLQTYRCDLLHPSGLEERFGGGVDIFLSIGLSTWLDEPGLDSLLTSIRSVLARGGVLVIDHWRTHHGSKYVNALQMPGRYVTDDEFEAALNGAGFAVEQKRVVPNGVVVVYRARPHEGT